jgi:uncharacterized membrane protein YfcA
MSPHWVINGLLNVTCLFSLYSLWFMGKLESRGETHPLAYQLKTATIGGIITGFLSTMTGLGGGVVIIPWLTGVTRLSYDQAMACSLLTVAFIAPLSAWHQGKVDLAWTHWFSLGFSIILAVLVVRKLLAWVPASHLFLVRKLALTTIILLSMGRTLSSLL